MNTMLQIVELVASVCNLGRYMNSEQRMPAHIGKVSLACFSHLHHLHQLRYIISTSLMQCLVSAFFQAIVDHVIKKCDQQC